MEPVVSVIIPNYNAEAFVEQCLQSVAAQSYPQYEIIVVDDGSTDKSAEIVEEFARTHERVLLVRQPNLNAAIARNTGMQHSSGKYLLFLDSDDTLYPDALEKMVSAAEQTGAELVLANYCITDTDNHIIQSCTPVKEAGLVTEPMQLVGTVPNPTNKLYRRETVEKNQLAWGNVRIGQDLNFYLKYLACCTAVATITDPVYGWRKVQGSISNSYSFRIFDIAESFRDAKRFYIRIGKREVYDAYVSVVEYRHYYLQMEKQKFFPSRKARKLVVEYFVFLLRQIDLKNSVNIDLYARDITKCKLKISLRWLYITKLYMVLDKRFARR